MLSGRLKWINEGKLKPNTDAPAEPESKSDGGGSSGGDTGGTLPANVLIAQTAEPAGANCPTGGTRITSGLDSNGNNVLDSSEVVATQFVCGATNGSNLLVATSTEPAGANCAAGGTRVTAGLDTNSNNVLDAGEVMTTSYVCNNPPVNMPWVTVTAATQAQPNTGYVVDSATPVTVTLPANASLAIGDRVAVYGLGMGGWTIAQNDGQSIDLAGLEAWTARESARNWRSVASSADGQRLVAVHYGGRIYTIRTTTTPGTTGSLSAGQQFDMVELQYLGNGLFMQLRSSGSSNFTYQ